MTVAEASVYIGISERFMREPIAKREVKRARIGKRVILDWWISTSGLSSKCKIVSHEPV